MMNLNKSSDFFSKKHLLLIPVLLLMLFANMPMQAQEPDHSTSENSGINATFKDSFTDAPVLKGEQTIGVIRGGLKMETLQIMQREFKKRGVELNYSNIDFTKAGKLSRIRIDITDWGKHTQSIELDNKGAAIDEVMTVYILHNTAGKSAKIGLQKSIPEGLPEVRLKLLKKFTGIVVMSGEGDVYAKGHIALGEGPDSEFGDIEHSEKRSKSQN